MTAFPAGWTWTPDDRLRESCHHDVQRVAGYYVLPQLLPAYGPPKPGALLTINPVGMSPIGTLDLDAWAIRSDAGWCYPTELVIATYNP